MENMQNEMETGIISGLYWGTPIGTPNLTFYRIRLSCRAEFMDWPLVSWE